MHVNEIRGIADQLVRAYDGNAWYGPPTCEVLAGITAEQAAARPIPQAHTIWELVLHMTEWEREALDRLRSGASSDPESGYWPAPPPEPTEENWAHSLAALATAHRELLSEIDVFQADRLEETLADGGEATGVSYYVLLHGIVQHNIAHTAQISILKKSFT